MGPSNHKSTAPADSSDPPGPPNRKWTAPPDSPGASRPPNCKRTVPSDSPGITHTGTACAGESPLPVKKQKYFNTSLLPNYVKWPTFDQCGTSLNIASCRRF